LWPPQKKEEEVGQGIEETYKCPHKITFVYLLRTEVASEWNFSVLVDDLLVAI
jgi:hypothetical protein